MSERDNPKRGIQLAVFEPFFEYGDCGVNVVAYGNFPFVGVIAVEAAGILRDGGFPRDRHCQEERAETRVM